MKALIETVLSLFLLFVVTPWLIVLAKRKKIARALGGGLYVAFLMLDPAMARALERIEVHQMVGNPDKGSPSNPDDPPPTAPDSGLPRRSAG